MNPSEHSKQDNIAYDNILVGYG